MNAITSTNGHGPRFAVPAPAPAKPEGKQPRPGVVCHFYSKADLAALFEVSVRTIETWTATGRLPAPRKVGRKWTMWVKAEIDALLAEWGKGGEP